MFGALREFKDREVNAYKLGYKSPFISHPKEFDFCLAGNGEPLRIK